MHIRTFVQSDLARLIELTIQTFGPSTRTISARWWARSSHLAVAANQRRNHVGTALYECAFGEMRALGAEVVEIGTGADPFHAPARALYERLGCTQLPIAVYYKQL